MKTYTMALALVLMATSAMNAQDKPVRYFPNITRYQHINSAKVEQLYLAALGTKNTGVLESSLAQVAVLKLALPVGSNQALDEKVRDIAATASSPEIRYKAFLTGMVLSNPELFNKMDIQQYDSPDELFAGLASRLSKYYAAR